jgi:hypothetical protein
MTRIATMAAVWAVAWLACEARGSLITNGSFESPVVSVGTFVNFGGGSGAITGWTVVGVDAAVTSTAFVQSGITFQAQDGAQWIDLAGVTSNSSTSGVRQTIPTTPGALYTVDFHVGSATDNRFFFPTTVDLSIDGGPRVSYTNPAVPTTSLNWLRFEAPFTAAGPTTTLTFFNGGTSNNFLNALDNVSVNEVPEPAAAALVSCLALVWPPGRRHRRA